MRWSLLAAVLASTVAHGQRIRLTSPSTGGSCTLDGSTQAVATSYRATTTTGTAYQTDAVLECSFDTGPGARNCIGTNVAGDILLGPGSGSGTTVRAFGKFIGLDFEGQNVTTTNVVTAGAALFLGTNASIQNNNSGKTVLVTDPEGLQINATTPIKGWVQAAVSVDFASISNGACLAQSVTVTGATAGDAVWANADFALPLGVSVGNVRVTAANTVELTLCNITAGGALDPAAGNFVFRLSR